MASEQSNTYGSCEGMKTTMSNSAVTIIQPAAITTSPDTAALVDAFLAGKSTRTIAAYRADLTDFAAFVNAATLDDAARALFAGGAGAANLTALNYRASLMERGMAAATINRRLAALRSLVALAQTIGIVPYELNVPGVKAQAYRDVRGPGDDGFRRMLVAVEARGDAKGIRDRAILHLLHDLALRRGEVVSLDRVHLDLGRNLLMVLGKGRTGREPLTLPAETRMVLTDWLTVRGEQPGPLFTNMDRDRTKTGRRLTASGIYRLIRRIGDEAGIRTRPHGLRHLGITHAIIATGGNVQKVQQFSRHKDVRTVLIYNDATTNHQGEVAALVAGFAKPDVVRNRGRQRVR